MKSPDFFKPRETHTKAHTWGECLIYIKVPLDETKAQALKKNWESKGDPKEPRTHKKNHCSTSR
jgi:hypothetical protein